MKIAYTYYWNMQTDGQGRNISMMDGYKPGDPLCVAYEGTIDAPDGPNIVPCTHNPAPGDHCYTCAALRVCEMLFAMFNINRPDDYHGPSMSVGSVVTLGKAPGISYAVARLGFEPVDISGSKVVSTDPRWNAALVLRQTKTQRIATLNDLARTAMGVASRVVQTCGISALPPADQSTIREKVETFNTFNEDNNPHGERDFGSFEHKGRKIFWKIDYYNRAMDAGSEDPSDPAQTTRVLTIMLATEY